MAYYLIYVRSILYIDTCKIKGRNYDVFLSCSFFYAFMPCADLHAGRYGSQWRDSFGDLIILINPIFFG